LFALASPSWAGGTQGAAPFNFLFLDPHPRAATLGGAYGAMSRDLHSLTYNPAGLAGMENSEISFMHNEHFQGISQDYLAWGLSNKNLAFSLNSLSFGKVQRTTLSNPSGAGLDFFAIRDWAFSVAHARQYKDGFLSLGLAGKYLQEKIDAYQAQTAALDLGFIVSLEPQQEIPVALGVSLQNLGPSVKFQSAREELPVNLKTGLTYKPADKAILALDLNQPQRGNSTLHLGTEWQAIKFLALRAGFNGRNDADSGLTLGFGLKHSWGGQKVEPPYEPAPKRALLFDYAFIPYGDLGASHRISLGLRW